MGPKKDLRSNSPASGFAGDSNDRIIDMLVQIQQSINTGNNLQQENLNTLTQKVDSLDSRHRTLNEEVNSATGLKRQISELQEQCGSQEDRMRQLEEENNQLKSELTILKNIVVHTAHRVDHNEGQITELKTRSMNSNILIHGIIENKDENLKVDIPELFKTDLGISNVKFASIHRMGKLPSTDKVQSDESTESAENTNTKTPKPRIIVGRLSNPEIKQDIFAKLSVKKVNFRVTGQYPEEVRDARSRLYYVKDAYEADEIECEIKGSKLIFKESKAVFREKVSLPSPELLLTASEPDVKSKLDKIEVFRGASFKDRGNHIVSFSSNVESYKDVSNFSLKVLASEEAIPANSNVLVYSFLDSSGKCHEGWTNDREFGAGLDILRAAKDNKYQNFAVILSRKLGEHLGYKRHQIFQSNAMSAVEQTQ